MVFGDTGGTRDSPDQFAQLALQNQPADTAVVRVQHHAGRCNEVHVARRRPFYQVVCLFDSGCHGFVEVHVLAGFDRLQALLIVQPNRRAERHSVNMRVGQQVIVG